jgi:hypothetical protein
MLIQYLLDSTCTVMEYTNTVIHTNGKKQCSLVSCVDLVAFVHFTALSKLSHLFQSQKTKIKNIRFMAG